MRKYPKRDYVVDPKRKEQQFGEAPETQDEKDSIKKLLGTSEKK